jgi:hypothetical protein
MTKYSGGSGHRRRTLTRAVAASLVVGGLAVFGSATAALAAATMTVTPNTGLSNGQSVSVSGSGFAAKSPGNVLECNSDPSQPTVALGSPVSASISVSCTAPSYTKLVVTSATGTMSSTFNVVSGTVGPPCGPTPAVVTCPSTDTAGKSPAADAASYPCPPTPAQQAAGDTCTLTYGDSNNDSAVVPIHFTGESTPTTTPPSPAAAAPTSGTTAPAPAASAGTGAKTSAGQSTGSGASAASPTAASAGTVAMTGPGPHLWWLVVAGLVLMNLGALLWLGPPRRWRRRAAGSPGPPADS